MTEAEQAKHMVAAEDAIRQAMAAGGRNPSPKFIALQRAYGAFPSQGRPLFVSALIANLVIRDIGPDAESVTVGGSR